MTKKRIGIITSGGDCSGLNAAIRAVITCAKLRYGWDVVGIHRGGKGLLSDSLEYEELDVNYHGLSHMLLRLGGTILGTTTHGNPLKYAMPDGTTKDRSQEIIDNYHKMKLDALIVIGGDGSLKIMSEIARRGNIPLIGIPKTIDNDIPHTQAIGFDTAVNVATEALDRLQPTAASHDRIMILELMGRDAGHIAMHTGIAGGADVILIPEIPFHMDVVVQKMKDVMASGRRFGLIVTSEAARPDGHEPFMVEGADGRKRYSGVGNYLGRELEKRLNIVTRVTILGHVQRGGTPLAQDRILGSAFGVRAVELIAQGKHNRMVAWQNRGVVDLDMKEAIATYQSVDLNGTIMQTAKGLNISLGV